MLYVYIFLSLLFLTLISLVRRYALIKTKYESAFTILSQLSSGLLMILVLPFIDLKISYSVNIFILHALSLFFWALTNIYLFKAFKHEEVSVLAPITPLYNVISYGILVSFFGAHLSLAAILGFILIISASFLSGFYKTGFKPSQGVYYYLLTMLFQGIAFALSVPVTKVIPSYLYIATGFTIPGLLNLFFLLKPKFSEIEYEIKKQWKILLVCALIIDLYYIFLFAALKIGNVSQVLSFDAAGTFLIVIGGIIFLKERKNVLIKLIASVLAFVGVVLAQF